MESVTYTINGQLATLNDHDKANRNNKFGGAKLKKDMTDLVMLQLIGCPKINFPCTIKFTWHYSGKHDFDNIRFAAKYILDGMVKAGILQNDSQKYVRGFDGDVFVKTVKGKEMVDVKVSYTDV